MSAYQHGCGKVALSRGSGNYAVVLRVPADDCLSPLQFRLKIPFQGKLTLGAVWYREAG